MYAFIEGALCEKSADSLVIDAGGVGYLLQVSGETLRKAPPIGQRFKCFTVLAVREDAMELYGFATREERAMYERLRTVSGIGPRSAMSILSTLSVHDLSVALITGDITALARAPGIGRKTAQRLALELRDKVDNEQLIGAQDVGLSGVMERGVTGEAIEALMALGYQSAEAARAVGKAAQNTDKLDEIIRLALKGMG